MAKLAPTPRPTVPARRFELLGKAWAEPRTAADSFSIPEKGHTIGTRDIQTADAPAVTSRPLGFGGAVIICVMFDLAAAQLARLLGLA